MTKPTTKFMGPLRIIFRDSAEEPVRVSLIHETVLYNTPWIRAFDDGAVGDVILNKSQMNFLDGLSDLAERWIKHCEAAQVIATPAAVSESQPVAQ